MAKSPTKKNIRVQYGIAIYDILALLPLAIPLIIHQHLAILSLINTSLGGSTWSEYNLITLIWMQLLGVIGTGWSIWRIKHVSIEIGLFEGGLRILVASTLIYAFFVTKEPLFALLAIIDILFSCLLLFCGFRDKFTKKQLKA